MAEGVLILGGTRGTGLEVAKILAGRGDPVTVLVREASDASALESLGVNIIRGNALDQAAIDEAMGSGEIGAAINTLGGKRGEPPRPDIDGTKNMITGAGKAGIKRVLLVTAIGAGDSQAAVAPKVLEVLGQVLDMKKIAENALIDAGLDYTILRPGGMTSEPASGTSIRTEDHGVMGVISRADLALLVVDCLDDDTSIGRIYHTVDPAITREAPLQRGEPLGDKK
jgi:uncharacterized protein YbjT (DUF2867 family)